MFVLVSRPASLLAGGLLMEKPLILAISDTHCGSTIGLMPESIEIAEGKNVVQANRFQRMMLGWWRECLDEFDEYRRGREFWLVLVGDLVEGVHHGGRQLWSSDPLDHSAAAVVLLEPVVKRAKRTFLAVGTECHTRNDETAIGKLLSAEICPDTGKHAWDTVILDIGPHRVHFRHHMPTTSRVYLEASALSIVLGNTQLSYIRRGQRPPNICVHAHRHRFGVYQDESAMFVAQGAWQGLTRHTHKVVPGAIPSPSITVLDWTRGVERLPHAFPICPKLPTLEAQVSWEPNPELT